MLANCNESDTDSFLSEVLSDTTQTLLEMIALQARRNPDSIAVSCGPENLTYKNLETRSNRFAHFLRERGVAPRDIVGIYVQRSLAMLVGLLGILKAGAAYLPLDPDHPAQRVRFMIEDSGIRHVVTEKTLAGKFPKAGTDLVCIDQNWEQIGPQHNSPSAVEIGSEDLAYLIYTSGSTGLPKGVAIPHRALTNLLKSMASEPGLESSDRLLAITTLAFDIAGLELYLPLIVGARVVIAASDAARNGLLLESLLARHEITAMQGTPATWRILLDSGWKGKRDLKVLCGGEALSRDLANSLVDRAASVWNLYGPTETTIWSTVERIRKEAGPVSIGRPIGNTDLYILGEDGGLVPSRTIGELYIGGAGLAREYWNRPELTAERFIGNPFGPPASRLYRTGDEARCLPDGRIECLGRKDNQVKIRGYRIELGEIEAVLRLHPDIRDTVVAAGKEASGESRLTAYFVSASPAAIISSNELRAHLQQTLPDYMIPSFFVSLPRIPLTPNGKIDRNALPAPTNISVRTQPFVEPRTYLEHKLTQIFEKVLGLPQVGVTDSFFDLGGHSLLAVRLFSEIAKETGRDLPLVTVFQAQSVEQLARLLANDDSSDGWSPLVAIQPSGTLPPFFCIHSQGSSVLGYGPLAALLGPEQPFYALQPRGLDGKGNPHTQIKDMAADYIEQIRKVQSEGPYYLGGVCLGGIIALEMAQQLGAAGQQVAFVGLIDSHFPGQPPYFPARALRPSLAWRLDRILGHLLCRSSKEKLSYVYQRLRDSLQLAFKSKLPLPLARVRDANGCAERAYTPQHYAGRLFLFWCAEWSFRAFQDKRLSWSEIAGDGLEVHVVPGNHRSMLEPPHVTVLARKLNSCLDRSRTAVLSQNTGGRQYA